MEETKIDTNDGLEWLHWMLIVGVAILQIITIVQYQFIPESTDVLFIELRHKLILELKHTMFINACYLITATVIAVILQNFRWDNIRLFTLLFLVMYVCLLVGLVSTSSTGFQVGDELGGFDDHSPGCEIPVS
jgi:hypothetical protein